MSEQNIDSVPVMVSAQDLIESERNRYRQSVASDLMLHHGMLHELHKRVLALEEAAKDKPRIALVNG